MGDFSFSVSADAEAFILQSLQVAESDPATAKLVPALCFVLGYQIGKEGNALLESYHRPFVEIGWYRQEVVEREDFTAIEVQGRTLYASGLNCALRP
jgi:hypothetical protein